ncbi:MAG: HAMP domain-containing sensor histidine kinase [Gemmatimonadota bacterium]
MTPDGVPDARNTRPSAAATRALRRLRLRVTAWYVGTFALVLVMLGALLFATLAHDLSVSLDASLRASTREIARAVERREEDDRLPERRSDDDLGELRIPDRELFLFDLAGRPLMPRSADSTMQSLARDAASRGSSTKSWDAPEDKTLQAYAERFTTKKGRSFVAAAVVNRDTIDDRYAMLLSLAGALGALGLVLVASGGWLLAQKSVAPVELTMERMRRFMADAAHELRTPVAVIRSRVEVTLERPRDAASYETTLTELRIEIERLAALVNDLFALARADADERAFTPTRVQLDEIVLEAVSTAGWIAARREIALEVAEAEEVMIDGDAALLRQLVLIILDNAIKFSNIGDTVTIAVRVEHDSAIVTIRDTGVGLADVDISRIFDRFYRAESVRGATTGAGLGLAIAKWIADVHGAQIAITPALERGTCVTMRFPAATPAQSQRRSG